MSSKETLVRVWEDGHRLLKDKWQWIVKHPWGCENAKRAKLHVTFFTQEGNMEQELRECRCNG